MSENTPGSSGGQSEEPPQQEGDRADDATGETTSHGVPSRPGQQGSGPQHGHQQTNPYSADAYAGAWQNPAQDHGGQQRGGQQGSHEHTAQFGAMNAVHEPEDRRGNQTRKIGTVLVAALLVGALGGLGGGVVGYQLGHSNAESPTTLDQPPPARSASIAQPGSVEQVAQKTLPSVVQLQMKSFSGSGEGSGIVLSSDGYILTNNHVVEGAEHNAGELTAQFHDGRTAQVKIVGADPTSDLAVVKADVNGLQPADLGRSDDLPVGAPVVAIGSPFGLSGTVTSGIISAKDRPVRAGGEQGPQNSVLNALQTDAAINPGNSGGPLVDQDGRVVGINSAIYSPGQGQQGGSVGLGFAIPIDQARRIANELKNTGQAEHTSLGVTIQSSQQQPGATVVQVVPGGSAAGAGMRPGEVITKVDDRQIPDADSLIAAVRSHNPGDRVAVTTEPVGGGAPHTYQITLQGQK
jgi:putative serine protease PepD